MKPVSLVSSVSSAWWGGGCEWGAGRGRERQQHTHLVLVLSSKVAEEDGEEQGHDDEHPDHDEQEEEGNGCPARRPPAVVHDLVPVLPSEDLKDCHKGPKERVEVCPRRVDVFEAVVLDRHLVPGVVEPQLVGEELHAQEGEDVHEEQEEERQVGDADDGWRRGRGG